MKDFANIIILIQSLLLPACSEIIEFSPYDTDINTHEINTLSAARITNEQQSTSDTLKFALFSDVHENYADLYDVTRSINNQLDLKFVISCGDITCSGLVQEYKWYVKTVDDLRYPMITVIGNHDHLANGLEIFKKLFGCPNMAFTCGKYKFVTFNNTMWENHNVSPEYEWLSNTLADSSFINIVLAHIPPFAGEIDQLNRLVYNNILIAGNVKLCIHGHYHYFSDTYYNNIHTILADAVDSREYYVIKLLGDQSFVEKVKF